MKKGGISRLFLWLPAADAYTGNALSSGADLHISATAVQPQKEQKGQTGQKLPDYIRHGGAPAKYGLQPVHRW